MDLPTHEQVVDRIEAFIDRHGYAETRFGREATGEPNLVNTIRGGRSPSLKTLHRIFDFMDGIDHALVDTLASQDVSSGNATKVSAEVSR